MAILGPRPRRIWFYKAAHGQLRDLWQAWEDAGLLDRLTNWGGSYVPRFIRGSRTTLSNHAFGTAFDLAVLKVTEDGRGIRAFG